MPSLPMSNPRRIAKISTRRSSHSALSPPKGTAPTMSLPSPTFIKPRPVIGPQSIPSSPDPNADAQKNPMRTTKTTQKLIMLPSTPQRSRAPSDEHEYEKDFREKKSAAERMSIEERNRAGFKRITAYCVADGLRKQLLASFLKREHNVKPRVFDEAIYVMYYFPLLPGYGPNTSVRSSNPQKTKSGQPMFNFSEVEEAGYQGTYFPSEDESSTSKGDDSSSLSPDEIRQKPAILTPVPELDTDATASSAPAQPSGTIVFSSAADESHLASSSVGLQEALPFQSSSSEDSASSSSESSSGAEKNRTPIAQQSTQSLRETHSSTVASGTKATENPIPAGASTAPPVEASSEGSDEDSDEEDSDEDSSSSDSPSDTPQAASGHGLTPVPGAELQTPGPKTQEVEAEDDNVRQVDDASMQEAFPFQISDSEESAPSSGAENNRVPIAQQSAQRSQEVGSSTIASGTKATEKLVPVKTSKAPPAEASSEGSDEEDSDESSSSSGSTSNTPQAAPGHGLTPVHDAELQKPGPKTQEVEAENDNVGQVVFFEYGVAVFFGLTEEQEYAILEDVEGAGVFKQKLKEDDWEIEECHFVHDSNIARPRVYNNFFTLKSRSHLLKLSIAHALAQSTLLSYYESLTDKTLSSPQTMAIPTQLATLGALKLKRREAMKVIGRLFKLRRDVNLRSYVLDTPELFWSEASLGKLYEAVRDYMDVEDRVEKVNEKLSITSEFLDAIHDHLNNDVMERITWVFIWLIFIAVVVEVGEILARLVVHSRAAQREQLTAMDRETVLGVLDRMMR